MVWEVVFLLVILKIPIVYLCCVVYWAIKAEPKPLDGAAVAVSDDPDLGPARWSPRRGPQPRRPRRGPHGAPQRRYARAAVARTRAEADR